MPSARARFHAHVDGLTSGDFPLSVAWSLAAATGKRETVTLASGDTTLVIPSGTQMIVLVPPAANVNTLRVKGAGGDTGVVLAPNLSTVLTYTSGSVIINASASTPGVEIAYL